MGWKSTGGVSNINDLTDVDTTGLQNQDGLLYETSSTTWKAALLSVPLVSETGGILELEDGTITMNEPTFRS